jgi:predicted TPR repeat methyltransferase
MASMSHDGATLAAAIAAHQAGRLDEADGGYEAVLRDDPGQADALHFRGMLVFQRQQTEAGILLVRRSLEAAPGNAHAWNSLGNMLQVTGARDSAIDAYRKATELLPELHPAWYNLGILQRLQGEYDACVACMERALAVQPRLTPAYEAIGIMHYARGDYAAARELYHRWLAIEPDNPIARHMAQATDPGQPAPERANDDYVRKIFDEFAENFDRQLAALDYRAPALVAALVQDQAEFQSGRADVLDAGCGTGLCGPLLRSTARRLVGVDLSGQMLQRARTRDCYDELIEAELCAAMRDRPAAFDLIVSADTIVYFGALDGVYAAAFSTLRPGGAFAFTVEAWLDWTTEAGFQIDPSGRYRHDRDYVTARAEAAGFDVIEVRPGILRQERGEDVHGLVVLLRRPVA